MIIRDNMEVNHILKPIYDENSQILILGTIPSPKSREIGFYYGHPQNRFWKIISSVLNEPYPNTNEEKEKLVLKHHIALWDVLASCQIDGASDNSIKNAIPNDLNKIIKSSNIKYIFTTGKKAEELYIKLSQKDTEIISINLLSTSPANCAYSFDKLKEEYTRILDYLE